MSAPLKPFAADYEDADGRVQTFRVMAPDHDTAERDYAVVAMDATVAGEVIAEGNLD